MKIDDLLIPARLAGLFVEIYSGKREKNIDNLEWDYTIPESMVCKIFMEMGAKQASKLNQVIIKNEKNESGGLQQLQLFENQTNNSHLPKELVEIMKSQEVNLLRAIMLFKGLELKTVANRYGGSSATANVANFLARSNEDLRASRLSTLQRLASALDCPPEWLTLYYK